MISKNNFNPDKNTSLNINKDFSKQYIESEPEDARVNKLIQMPPNVSETLLPKAPCAVPLEKASVEAIEACRPDDDDDEDEETFVCDQVSYGIGDSVFSCAVVAPLVVGVWRGTWGVMEAHADMFPAAQSYCLGLLLHVSFAVLRSHLISRARARTAPVSRFHWCIQRAVSRLYTYVFTLANIMHWRGGWGLLDALTAAIVPRADDPHRPVLIAVILLVLYISISLLRSSRNLLASPYFLVTDGKDATFLFTTRFKASNSRETALYVLDCIFSVGVVGSLVVFVWRGSWALLDIFLYPEDQVKSCWTSLIVGYGIVVVTFALQGAVRWATARLHGAARLLLADVYYLTSFCATVNVWRGVWGLLDVYFFPETPKLSNWCSHVISFALLVLLNCSNSVLVRGVYIDAEEPAGECVVFPCHYLRLYFHKERTKKRHKRALAAAAAAGNRRDEIAASAPLQMHEQKV